jgi:hypothetical protein
MYPAAAKTFEDSTRDPRLESISSQPFKQRKQRLFLIDHVLGHVLAGDRSDEKARAELVTTILESDNLKPLVTALQRAAVDHDAPTSILGSLTSSIVTYLKGESSLESRVKDILKQAKTMDDAAFLSRMATLADLEPLLAESVTETARLASDYLRGVIQLKVSPLSDQIKVLQRDALRKAFDRELAQARDEAVKSAHATLLDLIANICVIEDARFVGWHSRLTSSSDKSLQKSGHH